MKCQSDVVDDVSLLFTFFPRRQDAGGRCCGVERMRGSPVLGGWGRTANRAAVSMQTTAGVSE